MILAIAIQPETPPTIIIAWAYGAIWNFLEKNALQPSKITFAEINEDVVNAFESTDLMLIRLDSRQMTVEETGD